MTRLTFIGLLLLFCSLQTQGQYPKISAEVAQESARRKEAMERHSDEAWEKALPIIQQGESQGKPYIPWAAHPDDLPQADIPAFPGAQGGGMYSFGGRGGKVMVVTNLNDRGPGSFREALEAGGPRIVVFNVAGIIHLKERIRVRAPYITIAGSTAPGDGVCIAGDTVELETHDVVIRHMRFRRGQTWVGDRNDSIGGNPIGNIMIDHVSASWGLDENMSMYRHMYTTEDGQRLKLPTVNITIQNSIFGEALNTHNHAFGSTIGGYNATFHHNLWAHNAGRNPSIGMIYDFTFVNNVVYNWRHRTTDGGDHRSFYTIINNYYKPGPVTPRDDPIAYRIIRPDARRANPPVDDFGQAYVAGNITEANAQVSADNWAGGVQVKSIGEAVTVLKSIQAKAPYPHAYLEIESAQEAYQRVLTQSGATLPRRDRVDQRMVESVRTGQTTAKAGPNIRQQLSNPAYSEEKVDQLIHEVSLGLITDVNQVGGYPEYKGTPYADADHDGMPDDWEIRYGLDPHDANDSSGDLNGDGYTNIEEFINGRSPAIPTPRIDCPHQWKDLFSDDMSNAEQRYPIAVCDWMILKRQKLGAFERTHEIGADGLELDMGSLGQRVTFESKLGDPIERQRFLDEARQYDLEICSIAMSGFYAQSFAERPTVPRMIKDTIDTMKHMNVKVAFLPLGVPCDLAEHPELRSAVVERLRWAGTLAQDAGVVIGIETSLSAADEVKLLDEIDSPAIKSYFNVAQALKHGRDVCQELKTLGKDRLCQIHCTDTDGVWLENNPRLDMAQIKQTLDEMDWSGWLVIERSRDATRTGAGDVVWNYGANARYLKSVFQEPSN